VATCISTAFDPASPPTCLTSHTSHPHLTPTPHTHTSHSSLLPLLPLLSSPLHCRIGSAPHAPTPQSSLLEVHFRLLRHDMVQPLAQVMQLLLLQEGGAARLMQPPPRQGADTGRMELGGSQLFAYRDVQLQGVTYSKFQGVQVNVSASPSEHPPHLSTLPIRALSPSEHHHHLTIPPNKATARAFPPSPCRCPWRPPRTSSGRRPQSRKSGGR
jgi:hypothetical protein